jgi:ubiquitin
MNYEEAVKLGQNQLDEEKARKEQPKPAEPTVAEVARHYDQLKQLEQQVKEFCGKNPALKSCKEKAPYQLAQELFPQVQKQVQVQKAASPASVVKPAQ